MNGELVLYDHHGGVTSRLDARETADNDVFRGRFLKGRAEGMFLQLTRPKAEKSVVCIFRTHFWNEEVARSFAKLREAWSGDLLVAADQTNPFHIPPEIPQISHTQEEFAKQGLAIYPNAERCIWHMGDYPIYSMIFRSDYDYILMVEHDVVAHEITLQRCVQGMISDGVDCAGSGFQQIDKTGYWYQQQTVWNEYEFKMARRKNDKKCFWTFFPVIFISKDAAHHLFARRVSTGQLWRSGFVAAAPPFCETFVPTELVDAGFEVAKLSEYTDFDIDLTIKAKSWLEVEQGPSRLVHPVNSGRRLFQNIMHQAGELKGTVGEKREWLSGQAERLLDDEARALLSAAITGLVNS
jgi:hypothetical protein